MVESAKRLGGKKWNERRGIEVSSGIDRKTVLCEVCSILLCFSRVDRNNMMNMICCRCAEKTCEVAEI